MYCFKKEDRRYGILFHDDFICVLDMDIRLDYYYGIRVLNDKLDELLDALNQINTGIVSSVTVAGGSPIWKCGNNYNADILIRRSDKLFSILSGRQSGNNIILETGGIITECKVLPELIQALNGVVINGAFDVGHFIAPDGDSDHMYWIIVLKFDDRVVLLNLDSKNKVQGMNIPNSKISAVSKKLMKKYLTHMRAISQGIDANTDFSLTYSNGYSSLYLPSADSALFVAQTLLDIKDSQQP